MSKDNGGPAFPVEVEPGAFAQGVTVRDYFAANALQGICASGPTNNWTNASLANEAFSLADAMLLERAK